MFPRLCQFLARPSITKITARLPQTHWEWLNNGWKRTTVTYSPTPASLSLSSVGCYLHWGSRWLPVSSESRCRASYWDQMPACCGWKSWKHIQPISKMREYQWKKLSSPIHNTGAVFNCIDSSATSHHDVAVIVKASSPQLAEGNVLVDFGAVVPLLLGHVTPLLSAAQNTLAVRFRSHPDLLIFSGNSG